jgi:hypothetical protein
MKTKLLLPYRYKLVGWVLLVPATLLGILFMFFDVSFNCFDLKVFAIFSERIMLRDITFGPVRNNITDEIAGVLFIVGALLVAFSKEKQEDEFIAKARWESLVWATYINYAILIFCFVFFYDMSFLYVMILNMFTVLIFFIVRFYYILHITNKSLGNEE